MKTLTEISGSVIRVAAAAVAEARRRLPREEQPATPADAPAPDAGADASSASAAPDAPSTPPAGAKSSAEPESEAAKTACDAAVASATGLSGDRLAMVRGAVEVVGRRAADVRLVRVLGPEEQATGATRLGDYQYLVDLFPASMKQVALPSKEGRGQRGGGGRGGGRGSGGRGAPGSATGGFSMDSLRDDRKNDRGGGRGRPGGGRKPGGGSGGPPGGSTPKK